jgi:hypothetical protein
MLKQDHEEHDDKTMANLDARVHARSVKQRAARAVRWEKEVEDQKAK